MGYEVIRMDDFADRKGGPSVSEAIRNVAEADIYIAIVTHSYGYVPDGSDNPERLSMTELSYREARNRAIPCLIFLLDEKAPWPVNRVDTGEARKKLAALREEMWRERVVGKFSKPDDLAVEVVVAVANLEKHALPLTPPPPKYDVFFSYNALDMEPVSRVAAVLQQQGVSIWWDRRLSPGDDWLVVTETAFMNAHAVAVFVGPKGIGDNQSREVSMALLRKAQEADSFLLIPVILPNTPHALVPADLAKYRWVAFGESIENSEVVSILANAIRGIPIPDSPSPAPTSTLSPSPASPSPLPTEADLQMVPELLYRLVAKNREREEMLQSPEVTAFWSAVRKVQPNASTLADLRAVHAQLAKEKGPGALWVAWIRNTKSVELAALLQPSAPPPAGTS